MSRLEPLLWSSVLVVVWWSLAVVWWSSCVVWLSSSSVWVVVVDTVDVSLFILWHGNESRDVSGEGMSYVSYDPNKVTTFVFRNYLLKSTIYSENHTLSFLAKHYLAINR